MVILRNVNRLIKYSYYYFSILLSINILVRKDIDVNDSLMHTEYVQC